MTMLTFIVLDILVCCLLLWIIAKVFVVSLKFLIFYGAVGFIAFLALFWLFLLL